MEYIDARVNQLFVEHDPNPRSQIKTFSAKPSRKKAAEFGTLFGLIEIESTSPKISHLIDFIVNEVKQEYYPNELPINITIAAHFESSLKKINLAIASFLEQEHISLDLSKLNIVIGLSYKNEVHFSVVGRAEAILFYRLTSGKYKIINIIDSAKIISEEPNPLKLFSQIVSGKIRPLDVIVLSTTNLFDYFSLEKIKNTVTSGNTLGEGLDAVREIIDQTQSHENFGIIATEIKKVAVAETAVITPTLTEQTDIVQESDLPKPASKDSIDTLMNTERQTAKLLSPSALPEFKKYVSLFQSGFKNYLDKAKASGNAMYQKNKTALKQSDFSLKKPNIKLPFAVPPLTKSTHRISDAVRNNVNDWRKQVGGKSKNMLSFLAPAQTFIKTSIAAAQRVTILNIIGGFLAKLFAGTSRQFYRLPRSSQILLVAVVILAVLFSGSVYWISAKEKAQQRAEHINAVLVEAENKKNTAESSLIYRDENQARQLLSEARDMVLALEKPTETQQQQIQLILNEIDVKLKELLHETVFEDPLQIFNYRNIDQGATVQSFLITHNERAFIQTGGGAVVTVSLSSRTAETGQTQAQPYQTAVFITPTESVLLDDNNNVALFNVTNQSVTPSDTALPANSAISAAATFNGRLYLVDTENNQIYRFNRLGSNFSNRTDWLQESADVRSVTSIAVDGSLFALTEDGTVLKFNNGRPMSYSIGFIEPPLVAPTKLYTDASIPYLYILDPGTNRLVVLNKEDGSLIQQYSSPKFSQLKDFTVRHTSQDIIILADTSIFAIPASHL